MNFSTSAKATISSNLRAVSRAAHAEDRAIQEYIFATGKFRMKAGADFKQTAHPAIEFHAARGGPGDARQDFEESGLAGAIAADEAEDFAGLDLESDIVQGPKVRVAIGTVVARPRISRRKGALTVLTMLSRRLP